MRPEQGAFHDIVIQSMASGEVVWRTKRRYPGAWDGVSWSPSGRYFACGSGYTLEISDSESGPVTCNLGPPTTKRPLHWIRNILWSPDETELIFVHGYKWGATADESGFTLCAVQTDGSGFRQLTADETGHPRVCIASDRPVLRPPG